MTSHLQNRFAALLLGEDSEEDNNEEESSSSVHLESAPSPIKSTATTTTPSSPPGFTIAVGQDFNLENAEGAAEGNTSTAYALNKDGDVLASLEFSSMEELWSDEFYQRMATAVVGTVDEEAAATAIAAEEQDQNVALEMELKDPAIPPPQSIVDDPYCIDLTQDLNEDEYGVDDNGAIIDACYYDYYYAAMWAQAEAEGTLDDDSEAATLQAILRIEEEDAELERIAERDADLALAMLLQEQEHEQAARVHANSQSIVPQGNGCGAWRKVLSTSGAEVPAGLLHNQISSTLDSADFPALATIATNSSLSENKQQLTWKDTATHRGTAPHRPPTSSLSNCSNTSNITNISNSAVEEDDDDPLSPRTLAAIRACDEVIPLEILGYRVVGDALAQENFLDAAARSAKKAVLQSEEAAQMAGHKENDTQRGEGGSSRGVSVGELRHMMSATSAAQQMGAIAGGRRQENSDNVEDLPEYSKKSIRKLVGDMISAGWRPLPGRGGGHYMYERRVPPTGHRQLLVLPSTPSDCRSIDNTHSRLQRLDREAAEVRRRAAAGSSPLRHCN